MIRSSQELDQLQNRYATAISRQLEEKPHIYVGAATCGRASGALELIDCINAELDNRGLSANVVQVGCIGLCYAEPLVDIAKPNRPRICYPHGTPEMIPLLIEEYLVNDNPRSDLAMGTVGDGKIDGIPDLFDLPVLKPQAKIALRNCGHINAESLPEYIARGGYQGLAKVLTTMTPAEAVDVIEGSGLREWGEAEFPTGRKWGFASGHPEEIKYIVCNADEGDPGAFMNRSLLEGDPHRVLEGMLIAAYAIGAQQGYIYVRAEYLLAVTRFQRAIDDAKQAGLVGDSILGSNFSCRIDIMENAGAFVCGEETAMISAMEGKRGMPRRRPPFPTTSGLWKRPTVINNVETLAHVPGIIVNGVDWFRSFGTPTNPGTKTFALTGKVNNNGLVEIPLGLTIRQLIFDIGGGIAGGKAFKAVQVGGPSGGCLCEEHLDYGIDYESLTAAGAMMGSGGLVVLSEDDCMVEIARFFMKFIQNESCGKCVPCREGTKQMLEILTRITTGDGQEVDIDLLTELATTVKDGSLCALGKTAPNPVLTTLRYFRNEYIAHIHERRCRAKACPSLISYHIVGDKWRLA